MYENTIKIIFFLRLHIRNLYTYIIVEYIYIYIEGEKKTQWVLFYILIDDLPYIFDFFIFCFTFVINTCALLQRKFMNKTKST